jgi:cytochrome c oxidase assembly protein subunit 11
MTEPTRDPQAQPVSHKKLLVRCGIVVVCMAAFPWASIPLYNAFCQWTGLRMELSAAPDIGARVKDASFGKRDVTVEFVADASLKLPWTLKPEMSQMKIKVGESVRINFYAENTSSRDVVARAVPSITPAYSSPHFKKTQCFCFDNIQLKSGETMEMPVVFYLDENFPDEVATVTLAYKVFDVTDKVEVITAAVQPADTAQSL